MTEQVKRLRNLTKGTVVAERVEVATSLWGRFRGLMGRSSLDDGHGLWLPGTNGIHMLFMRFAIDCAFLASPGSDGSMEVLSVRRSLPPWSGIVWFVQGAKGVVELPAGALGGSRTEAGDRLLLGESVV